jgi:hypothetical protein
MTTWSVGRALHPVCDHSQGCDIPQPLGRLCYSSGATYELRLDASGAPWIAYEEVGLNDKKSVQKYVGGVD